MYVKILCTTEKQLECVENISLDKSNCYHECEGMEIISYNEFEIVSDVFMYSKQISNVAIFDTKYFKIFDTKPNENTKLLKTISKLSDQYNKYKGVFDFPRKYKGTSEKNFKFPILFSLGYKYTSKLHYVKIYFETPKFERIIQDRAAKPMDMMSAIGGTMGLLTGFSIISGVELIYFTVKITFNYFISLKKKSF